MRKGIALTLPLLFLYACAGSGGGGATQNNDQGNNNGNIVGSNYIISAYGNAKIEFKNAVVEQNNYAQGVYAQGNKGNITVYGPHTGVEFDLTLYNADSNSTYLYVTSSGANASNQLELLSSNASLLGISCYDPTNNQNFADEQVIKITHESATETASFNANPGEGNTISFDNFRLYDLISQGSNDVCDLGDYFQSFNVYANDITDASVVSTSTCPSIDLGNGNVEVPYDATCLEINLDDKDSVGTNHRYSVDGTNWQSFTPPVNIQLDISSISLGGSGSVNLYVKEDIGSVNGNTIEDSISYTWNVIKNTSSSISGYCADSLTGNTWQVNSGDTCVFSDPKGNVGVLYNVKITFNDTGNCEVVVYKNGSQVDAQQMSCSNGEYTYGIDASEKGTQSTLNFEVYKIYDNGNKVLIGNININYRVNQAPQLTINTPTQNPKEGQDFFST